MGPPIETLTLIDEEVRVLFFPKIVLGNKRGDKPEDLMSLCSTKNFNKVLFGLEPTKTNQF